VEQQLLAACFLGLLLNPKFFVGHLTTLSAKANYIAWIDSEDEDNTFSLNVSRLDSMAA
jgi:hypothetical protein